MNEPAQRETPHLGIFWVVQTPDGDARLLAAGCPLDQAESYGDCLTFGPGHYETWAQWRRDKAVDPALRAIVRSYEYEDWPRGRIVFDRSRDLFIIYADRKLQTPDIIARIETQFLPLLPIEAADFSQSHGWGTAITAVRVLSALLAVRRRALFGISRRAGSSQFAIFVPPDLSAFFT
jgi:hypothetical protein